MAKRDTFLLRVDPHVLDALRTWADDEMRSVNGQIEYLLRESLRRAGRASKQLKSATETGNDTAENNQAGCDEPT